MENIVIGLNHVVVNLCQMLAILVIAIGISKSLIIFIKDALFGAKAAQSIRESRLELGHSFSLGLSFLIGSSILKTTIAPTWNDIGQLTAIIAIRTLLNYFLLRDIATLSTANGEEKNDSVSPVLGTVGNVDRAKRRRPKRRKPAAAKTREEEG
jgi:uncharacterized membrane protein